MLYGVAKVEGAPSIYVMEYLSESQGWLPLRYAAFLNNEKKSEKLATRGNNFLRFMQTNSLVHGDLRANNMLFREHNDDIELQVLDWDWAGRASEVRYPLDRNPKAKLPGSSGGFIHTDHDSITLMEHLEIVKQLPLR
jgi:hypothetical protein